MHPEVIGSTMAFTFPYCAQFDKPEEKSPLKRWLLLVGHICASALELIKVIDSTISRRE
jgi:hypothetical protein